MAPQNKRFVHLFEIKNTHNVILFTLTNQYQCPAQGLRESYTNVQEHFKCRLLQKLCNLKTARFE